MIIGQKRVRPQLAEDIYGGMRGYSFRQKQREKLEKVSRGQLAWDLYSSMAGEVEFWKKKK